ncbi:hypothetical protein [Chelativorans sp. YIM 93263]|uniref:hypothetical protein n=1 Tax=Chelativorans sp. YIM 93263 TaxID=2906648 RepID=UPI002379F160|nr:hypothetical protein [Chelativorans sp. YIM 93263]
MATILSFTPPARDEKARSSSPGGEATIIVFTGVQYERIEDDGSENEPEPACKRVRRRRS